MGYQKIEYIQMPGISGDYFNCSRLHATLSTKSCAQNWRDAMANPGTLRLHHCKGCPIGALHAGEAGNLVSPLFGSSICARCHEGGRRLLQGRLCICCYNRQLEALKGKNAKGSAPKKLSAAALHRRLVKYSQAGKVAECAVDLSRDTTELLIGILRGAKGNVQFGFSSHPKLAQARLF